MANISTEEDYKPTEYFQHRHGDESVEHCVGNSCENLIGLDKGAPAAHLEVGYSRFLLYRYKRIAHNKVSLAAQIPQVQQPPSGTVNKPARSDPDEVGVGAQIMAPDPQQVYVHSLDANTFPETEYYSELRRRSLEGRAPIRFENTSGEHPLQENLASEEFDVALY